MCFAISNILYSKKRTSPLILYTPIILFERRKKYFLAQEDYLKLSFQTISDNYGNFHNYLKKIGIDENAVAKLFAIYTD